MFLIILKFISLLMTNLLNACYHRQSPMSFMGVEGKSRYCWWRLKQRQKRTEAGEVQADEGLQRGVKIWRIWYGLEDVGSVNTHGQGGGLP